MTSRCVPNIDFSRSLTHMVAQSRPCSLDTATLSATSMATRGSSSTIFRFCDRRYSPVKFLLLYLSRCPKACHLLMTSLCVPNIDFSRLLTHTVAQSRPCSSDTGTQSATSRATRGTSSKMFIRCGRRSSPVFRELSSSAICDLRLLTKYFCHVEWYSACVHTFDISYLTNPYPTSLPGGPCDIC